MNDTQDFGFGKFVPGFDFLQNLAKGASEAMPQMPGMANWIAPTLSVEELDKRISELRAVQFWLEQNGKALAATIQALEVQKMTLSTLKSMDLTMADLAEALKAKPQARPPAEEPARPAPAAAGKRGTSAKPPAAQAPAVDPLQWWTALTQQFQQIATSAMQQGSAPVGEASAAPRAKPDDAAGEAQPAKRAARKPAAARKKAAARGSGAAS